MNIVRSAEKKDGSAIEAIMGSLSSFTETDRRCVRELWEDYTAYGTASEYQFCICQDFISRAIAGFACFGKHALTENTFDLYWIAVDPASQRGGVGSDLLSYTEQQALAQDGRRLIIETSSTEAFAAARRFYRHHGYLREAVIRDFYAPGDHLIIFTKDLVPPGRQDETGNWEDNLGWKPDYQIKPGPRRTRSPG